jgi:penicillin-binding protein 2
LSSKRSLSEFGYTAEELEGIKGLLDLGYSVDGLIGIQGIEKTMEAYLTGDIKKRQGIQNVEVDSKKIIRNILSTTEPKQGDSTVLTIDVPFQQAVERSLEENIALIREEQIEQYNQYKDKEGPRLGKKAYKGIELEDIDLAESGAAVVLDVNTGEVLAMASYPSFDLNLFVKGMTKEEYKAYGFEDKELAPLLNRAVSSRGTPGSIFKMVTGLGALMEGQKDPSKGTILSERIDDEGLFYLDTTEKTSDAPNCWIYPSIHRHQNQTIVEGLQNSCNYYFYTLSYRMGISKLNEWGEKYGLTVRTGIELPGELAGQVGGQTILFDPGKPINMQASYMPRLVFDGPFGIVKILSKFAEDKGLNYDEEEIKAAAREIVYLMGIEWETRAGSKILVDGRDVAMGDHIRSILYKHLNITAPVANASNLVPEISSMLSQLMWKPINTIQTGIGQGYVQLTPLAVARYVAAIVNGGVVYEAQIVDKVIDKSGELVYDKQPVVYNTLDAPQEFLDKIKEGMSKVVSAEQGTAEKYFRNFKYKDDIGGKTGTAEVSDIDLENNSWFVCFAPYDKPKIAVVAYVPHGLSGGLSSYIAQDIVEFYLDREAMVAEQTIPVSDSLIGQ